jgi:hypothetical protein
VTPGDLWKTDSLFSLGRLDIGSREIASARRPRPAIVVVKGEPIKRALLVGINRYQDPRANLKGCVNDSLMMWNLLTENYGFERDHIRMLTDERATTDNIRKRLRWLVRDAVPGSVLVFHFAGHGSQVRDRGPDDELDDHMDEILCPHDLDWDDPLTDDELASVIRLVPPDVNFTILLDCCHSGTGTREFFKEPTAGRTPASRFLVPPPDIAVRGAGRVEVVAREAERTVNMRGDRGLERRRFGRSAKQSAILLAGCRSDQTSSDAWIDSDNHGAFTYSLWRTLSDREFSVTHDQLIDGVRAWLVEHGYEQVPQLEAPAGQRGLPFLGVDGGRPRPRDAVRDEVRARGKTRAARVKNGGHRRPGQVAPAR